MLVADNRPPFLFLPKPRTPGLMSPVPRMSSRLPLPPSSLPHSKLHRIWENKGKKKQYQTAGRALTLGNGSSEGREAAPPGCDHAWAPAAQRPRPHTKQVPPSWALHASGSGEGRCMVTVTLITAIKSIYLALTLCLPCSHLIFTPLAAVFFSSVREEDTEAQRG